MRTVAAKLSQPRSSGLFRDDFAVETESLEVTLETLYRHWRLHLVSLRVRRRMVARRFAFPEDRARANYTRKGVQ